MRMQDSRNLRMWGPAAMHSSPLQAGFMEMICAKEASSFYTQRTHTHTMTILHWCNLQQHGLPWKFGVGSGLDLGKKGAPGIKLSQTGCHSVSFPEDPEGLGSS